MFFGSPPSANKPASFSTKNFNPQLIANNYLQRFHSLVQQTPINEESIINHLKSASDILVLINLSLTDEKLASWCEHEKMQGLWDEVWWSADRNPRFTEVQQNPALIYRGLRPQLNISSFKLVCGITLFHSAERLIENGHSKNSEEVMSLLMRASNLGNYQALNALTNINVIKLHAHEFEAPEIILTPLYNAALWHGTPIYLLCATAHYHIANYYSSLNKMRQSHQAYQNALTYLYTANYCEASSEDEIYNAYNGAGITASNVLRINKIEQLIELLIEQGEIDTQAIFRARFAADRLAQNYLNLRQVNTHISPNYAC